MSALKNIFVEYPRILIRLLTNGAEISSKIKRAESDEDGHFRDERINWYFSQEGIDAYNALTTLGEKITFFYKYLRLIALVYDHLIVSKLAFIMANSMVDSKLEFGGYPNVIDEKKNPIVRHVKHHGCYDRGYCGDYLCILHNGNDKNSARYSDEGRPFERITYCKPGEELTDMYKIERDIISVFSLSGVSQKEKTFAPYIYSIIPTDEDKEDLDTEDEDYDDEDYDDDDEE